MKILFISPRAFGLMGTPGTYHLVEAYARHADVCVIASSRRDANVQIVHQPSAALNLKQVAFGTPGYVAEIAKLAAEFAPDLVCMGNYHDWPDTIVRLKKILPKAKFVYDIKSPLIGVGNSPRRLKIQDAGRKHAKLLDLVMSRCAEDVVSWIPDNTRPVHLYPLGVQLSQFKPRKWDSETVRCSRFAFIGSYAAARKLNLLIGYIAKLNPGLRSSLRFDMFGSGPEEGALQQLVVDSGLEKSVSINGGLPQDELLSLLPRYDAGIAWVPREQYDAAPSLKMLEYMASGLVPIATSTVGHMRNLEEGFEAILFEENAASFNEAIEAAHSQGFARSRLEQNRALMEGRDWDEIAQKHLLPAFEQLLSGTTKVRHHDAKRTASESELRSRPVEGGDEFAPPAKVQWRGEARAPSIRILMITPRPFGLLGTPGTYSLAEAYAKVADVRVIANRQTTQNVPIVYDSKSGLKVDVVPFQTRRFLREVSDIARRHDPDIIWIGNYNLWGELVARLKDVSSRAKFVLDVKSPLLTGDDADRRSEVQDEGVKHSKLLDLVLALSAEDVHSWIPDYSGPLKVYPLGIDLARINPRPPKGERVECRRFIFVGSYHASRKLNGLLELIAGMPQEIRSKISIDMFGSGPEKESLEAFVRSRSLESVVRINDAIPQDALFAAMPDYDCGIAWVPRELFDAAPPLKTLEYMAAGLATIATDTVAHQRYRDEGYKFALFSEDQDSFSRAMSEVVSSGFLTADIRTNLERIASRDINVVANEFHLAAYRDLLEAVRDQASPERPNAAPKNRTAVAASPRPSDAAKQGETAKGPQQSWFNSFLRKEAASPHRRAHLWAPNLVPLRIRPHRPKGPRIAAVLSDRLFDAFSLETDILPLTSRTWRTSLEYGEPKLLLVESTWFPVGGDWYMAQSVPGAGRDELERLVKCARELGIPSVFWMTADSHYLHLYQEFAGKFDFVFCADIRARDRFASLGVQAQFLPPAAQPYIFNPIKASYSSDDIHPGALFDGWGDVYKYPEIRSTLLQLNPAKLSIIDTNSMFAQVQLNRISDLQLRSCIKGWIDRQLLPEVMKRADAYIMFPQSQTTRTQRAWNAVEAAACRTPVIHLGSIEGDDFRAKFAQVAPDDKALSGMLAEIGSDSLARERAAHGGWREVSANHGFANRLKVICDAAGVGYDPKLFPRVTLVTGTMRPHLLQKCIDQYEQQTYPNKELVLVFNGEENTLDALRQVYGSREDIVLTAMPTDFHAGSLLNLGAMRASGEYFFRVDDDDHYGPNYIFDCMLHLRAFDADIFGKRASLFHFEGEDNLYLRKRMTPEVLTFPAEELHVNDSRLISGCSFGCKTELLRSLRYPDQVNMSADSELIERIRARRPDSECLMMDNLNLVVERAANVELHTWQQNANNIKKDSLALPFGIAEMMV